MLCSEDTSVGARLLSAHGLRRSVTRLDEHASAAKIDGVLQHALDGKTVVYFSDAGTPGVSDPGPALVDRAYELGIEVDALPGPSAATTALMLSGFYAQRFVFLGFLPRKPGAMRSELLPYAESTTTLVFLGAPTRVTKALEVALETLGDRRAAICREMTKAHQEVLRSKISELITQGSKFKGECTVVLEGRRRKVAEGV